MQMTTLKAHRYGKQRTIGEKYEAKSEHVRLIKALGWAKETPPEPAPPAEPPRMTLAALAADETKPRRTYRRRDLSAEPSEG